MKLCKECTIDFNWNRREFESDLYVHKTFDDKQVKRILQLLDKHFKLQ